MLHRVTELKRSLNQRVVGSIPTRPTTLVLPPNHSIWWAVSSTAVLPDVIFSDPQVARVGLTETEATQKALT